MRKSLITSSLLLFICNISIYSLVLKNDSVSVQQDSIGIFSLRSTSQSQADNPDLLQFLSPNSFAFTQYGNIPVSLAMGLPQIDIPLIDISDKDININISLSYHASGIKVDQEASWVGLGWSLNTGGVITRVAKGEPDDFDYNGTFKTRTSIADLQNSNLDKYLSEMNYKLSNASSGVTDNEPDIFYYNFNGKSGKFFLDNNANVHLEKYEDFKMNYIFVKALNGDSSYFRIVDENGLVYDFKAVETSSYGNKYINSSWYLTKITSPSGGEVKYSYKEGGRSSKRYQRRKYATYYKGASRQVNKVDMKIDLDEKSWYETSDDTGLNLVIDNIKTSSGNCIQFIAMGGRKDSESGLANNLLSEIILKDSRDIQRKRYRFNYSYFEADNAHKEPNKSKDLAHLNYRLKLDNIREISSDPNLTNPSFVFEYYGGSSNPNNTNDPYALPYRLSPSQDHWGYYNASNNKTIFPNNSGDIVRVEPWFRRITATDDNFVVNITGGGTREPHAEAVKAGTLNKIIYPTGGYTKFNFEPHDLTTWGGFPNFGGIRIKQIENSDGNNGSIIKDYEYTPSSSYLNDDCFNRDTQYHTGFTRLSTVFDERRIEELSAFGIPMEIASNSSFNCYIKISSYPKIQEGYGELRTSYSRVTERIKGVGRTEYSYLSPQENFGWGGSVVGVATPGNGYSAYLRTQSVGFENTVEKHLVEQITPCDAPFPEFSYTGWRQDLLANKKVYNEQNVLLVEDSIVYETKSLHAEPGYKLMKLLSNGYEYIYARYYLLGGLSLTKKEISRQYKQNSNIIRSVTEYDYNSPAHKKMSDKRIILSSGDIINEKYYYPTEYNIFGVLVDKNILKPIDIRSYRNGKLISGTQVQYNNQGQPLIKYQAEFTKTDIPVDKSKAYTFVPYLWNEYTSKNLLSTQETNDGLRYIYVWSYSKQYPIAKIENATYSEVEAAIKSIFNNISLDELSSLPVPNEEKLLDGSLQKALQKALVTTYTYNPLIGMTSVTNPMLITTFYEYDQFGRLIDVSISEKDASGKTVRKNKLEHYDYNYRNK